MTSIPDNYLKMSQSELYIELANAISGGFAAPTDRDEAERLGFNYFQKVLPEMRVAVCRSPIITSLIKKDDVFTVASVIAEIISSQFTLPTAVATLAVLAARMGMKSLCPEVES